MSDATQESGPQGIAVVGMAGRFPQAPDVEALWRSLRDGREALMRFTADELLKAGVPEALASRPDYVPVNGMLADIELFDASFFGMTPREASVTDPQHRLFLELVWRGLEHSGCDTAKFDGSVGVYAGCGASSYFLQNLWPRRADFADLGDLPLRIANSPEYLATRASFKLGLTGPSISVNTACSTSLVAVHIACSALLRFECDMALAGGVSIQVPQGRGYIHTPGGIMSPDGHCRAFDAAAEGTVSGNGGGVVVLKRLEDALSDGDTIYAVIRGSAVNNDGSDKAGYTAPSQTGQTRVIAEALAVAGVSADTIDYVETHGTGTPLGDPIELAALTRAFRRQTDRVGYCAIGSLKTNIGHLDEAAGVAGLIKTILALGNRQIPPSLHFKDGNPEIDFATSPFYVNAALRDWPAVDGRPRRASVSSFGIGGTNAHLVIEEGPERTPVRQMRPVQLLPYSAKSPAALDRFGTDLGAWFAAQPQQNAADVAYTLQVGRRNFNYRDFILCADGKEAPAALSRTRSDSRRAVVGAPPVVFLFSGQGSQYLRMAQPLYECEPAFREALDKCAALLQPHLGADLRRLLSPISAADDAAAGLRLEQTGLAQPALFAVEYALVELWRDWGVQPAAMIGHSLGEYVAACVAGTMDLDTAVAVIAARGRLMQETAAGAMLAVPMASTEAERHLVGDVEIAAVNAPDRCVVAGTISAIESLVGRLRAAGTEPQRLHVSHAFHSASMEPALGSFVEILKRYRLHPPQLPYISNVSGDWISASEACDPAYYARHIRQPVQFARGIARLLQEYPQAIFLEIGPGTALTQLARRAVPPSTACLASLPAQRDASSVYRIVLESVGRLWQAGVPIDWSRFAEPGRTRIAVPGYPFERQRLWIEPIAPTGLPARADNAAKRNELGRWFYAPSWTRSPNRRPNPVERSDDGSAVPETWLLLVDGCGVGEALAEKLRCAQRQVITVEPGQVYSKTGPTSYQLRPGDDGDFDALMRTLTPAADIRHIVDLWSVTAAQGPDNDTSFDRFQKDGFYSLLALAKALAAHKIGGPLAITVVSNGIHDIAGGEETHAAKAAILGPVQVIQQEFPAIRCRSIDLPVALPESQRALLIPRLLSELLADVSDRTVALRGSHRWHQVFVPTPLGEGSSAGLPGCLRLSGTYLMVGGLGQIGYLLAHYLAETVRGKLALVGRSGLPSEDMWDAWLAAHPAGNAVSQSIARIRALRTAGAEVLVLQADVANEAEMSHAFSMAERRFGRIDGVIHAAGVAAAETFIPLEQLDVVACERQLDVKARGALVLERLLRTREPDFVLLFSSLSSVLGGLGFAAYAAANHVIDAVARRGSPGGNANWTSVNWDAWVLEGEANLPGGDRPFGIQQEESGEVFRNLFNRLEIGQIAVSTTDIDARLQQWVAMASLSAPGAAERDTGTDGRTQLGRPPLSTPYVAPRDETERSLAEIWQGLLGIESIGVEDDFFELNGDSLLAVQMIAKVNRELNSGLTLRDMFEGPTVAAMAQRARAPSEAIEPPILPAPAQADYVLTRAQRRLWILAQNPDASVAYNMSYCLRLHGTVQLAALRKAFELLIRRHESLRTAFVVVGGEPRQRIQQDWSFALPVSDVWRMPDPVSAAQHLARSEAVEPFKLDSPPLLRARLARMAEYEHLLLVSLHHIVGDGVSLNILMRELSLAYTAFCSDRLPALPQLPIQNKDFAAWQHQQQGGPSMRAARDHWRNKLSGDLPVLALPTDRPRAAVAGFAGSQVVLRLSVAERDFLLQRCREQGVTLFVMLVAALKVLLHRESGQDDIIVGTPVAGREWPELEGQIGYYLNTVVLRDTVRRSEPFTALLQRVRETVMGALAHQSYPFDQLIEDLDVALEPGRSPLFDVLINLMPSEPFSLQLGDLVVDAYPSQNDTTLFDLNFMFSDGPLGLALELAFSGALFDATTATQLGERLMRLLREIGKQPETSVRSLCGLFDGTKAKADKNEFLATALKLDEKF